MHPWKNPALAYTQHKEKVKNLQIYGYNINSNTRADCNYVNNILAGCWWAKLIVIDVH